MDTLTFCMYVIGVTERWRMELRALFGMHTYMSVAFCIYNSEGIFFLPRQKCGHVAASSACKRLPTLTGEIAGRALSAKMRGRRSW